MSERTWEMLGGFDNDLCKLEDDVIGGMYNYLRYKNRHLASIDYIKRKFETFFSPYIFCSKPMSLFPVCREEGEEAKIGLPPDGQIPYLRNIHLTSWLPGYLEMLDRETDEGGRAIAFPPPVFGESYMTRTSEQGSKLPPAIADEMTEGWRK